MQKTVEIVHGDSTYVWMKKSNLKDNEIILFNALFSISNLATAKDYKLKINTNISYFLINEYSFKEEMDKLTNHINKNDKIRIWSSHKDIEPYLLLLFICDNFKDKKINLYVTYSEELKDYASPAYLNEKEMEELSNKEHKLIEEEIKNYSKEWQELVKINSPFRVIDNGKIISTNLNYFDDFILNYLKENGVSKISRVAGEIMAEYHIQDLQLVYFIDELIKQNKIKVVEKSKERHFLDKIELVTC